eukprot:TRINITY_DN4781_c1_g1_i1.p1 TRINITY_DN4781_c1_g1~~TRINITY_DN4781_c1_g1_i1.p1  ORF type:complete len:547 (+),score=84.31 TRINITY_DN4781_c1_g1_i1:94-1734(+)
MKFTVLCLTSFLSSRSSAEAFVSPPSQVALAAGRNADREVSITWLTDDARDDEKSCKDVAKLEIIHEGSVSNFSGECLRFSIGSDPKLFGNYTSGRIHRVWVKGLKESTTYTYRLEGDPKDIKDSKRYFKTLPASSVPAAEESDRRYPFRFGVVGDLGQSEFSEENVRHLEANSEVKMILHAGDMSYSDTNAKRWDSYGNMIEPLASRMQWMVVPGNHEIESDFFTGENFKPYEARFAMPALKPPVLVPSPGQIGCTHAWPWQAPKFADCTPSAFRCTYDYGNSFYAFRAGPAFVLSINSYTESHPESAQYKWLKAELEALKPKRAETPWLIVNMHAPWYNSNRAHRGEFQAVDMRDAYGFEDLFMEHNVSIVFSGHVHAYERSHPVFRNKTQKGGPTYIVVGDGGNREGLAREYVKPSPEWSAYRDGNAYGHGTLLLENNTHMRWHWMQIDKSSSPSVITDAPSFSPRYGVDETDSVWIVNPYNAPPLPEKKNDKPSLWKDGLVIGGVSLLLLLLLVGIGFVCRNRRAESRALMRNPGVAVEMNS